MAGKFDIKFKNRFYKILKMYNVSDYLSPKQIKDVEKLFYALIMMVNVTIIH